jgi:hypothetical protein
VAGLFLEPIIERRIDASLAGSGTWPAARSRAERKRGIAKSVMWIPMRLAGWTYPSRVDTNAPQS